MSLFHTKHIHLFNLKHLKKWFELQSIYCIHQTGINQHSKHLQQNTYRLHLLSQSLLLALCLNLHTVSLLGDYLGSRNSKMF